MKEKKRMYEYDFMRITACFCVIMIHAAVFDQASQYSHISSEFQAINFWGVVSRWAVPCFVMLSGMMVLPKADEETISKLMIHRVIRMLAAFVFWSAVYSAYNVFALGRIYSATKLKTFIDGFFSGESHMWYLLMLAGLYICSPMLSTLVKKLNRKWALYWLGCLFLFSSVIPFLVKLNIHLLSNTVSRINGYMNVGFLGGWTIYFVLGHYVKEHTFSKKELCLIWGCSVLALLFTMYGTIYRSWKTGVTMGILPYEYPNILVFSIGVLLFIKEVASKSMFIIKYGSLFQKCSELTFGIFLIHVLVLEVLYSFGIRIDAFHPMFSVPIIALLVFLLSGFIIWIFRKIPVIGKYLA